MTLNETTITKAILTRYIDKLISCLELDVAIVGAGPSGMVAAYHLAKAGRKVAIFERKLSIGGGMWGGGMLFNEIVVQEAGKRILDELGIRTECYEDGYHTADAVEAVTTLCSRACQAGARVFNCITVEDVLVRENRVSGLVINWTAVDMAGLHVDPLAVRTSYVVDATGHATEVMKVVERKVGATLFTETGRVIGEKSMWAEVAEQHTLDNTKEAFPGIFVAGMAANATFGSYRMGPIFGGMLLSGEKVATLINERLSSAS
ncbi:MAG: sulfide-dependent adenosine diphosphate thiazole synthase [Pseudomonadota bacterium]